MGKVKNKKTDMDFKRAADLIDKNIHSGKLDRDELS